VEILGPMRDSDATKMDNLVHILKLIFAKFEEDPTSEFLDTHVFVNHFSE
jgi:hypothetical protein